MPRQLVDLLLLAAIWGSSFLFMRLGAAAFGPLPLAALRVGLAAAVLLPFALAQGHGGFMRRHWRGLVLLGICNAGLPFALFSYAAVTLPSALLAIFNATVPLWGALIAWAWLGERPGPQRALGLTVGFAGVVWLVLSRHPVTSGLLRHEDHSILLPAAACLLATVFYAGSTLATRRHWPDSPPLAVSAASLGGATLLLALPAAHAWPAATPGVRAWIPAVLLAVLCTALAFVLFFRLIERAGPAYAMSVTYLIPAFTALWAHLWLDEALTPEVAAGGGLILLGTALSNGLLKLPGRRIGA
jgi:drug/metabolite transporter (DMT)-like permease